MKITLEQALTDYEGESASLGHAPEYTRVTYVFLRKFKAACEAEKHAKASELPVRAITPGCITKYFTELLSLGNGSHNRALSAVRGFLGYLEDRNALAPGTTAKLLKHRKIKPHVRKRKHYIPAQQFGLMLDLSARRHAADRAAMAVALYTLSRQGEIASIRLKDIDFSKSTLRIHRHKRDRWTDVTMCPDLAEEIALWLNDYADHAGYESVVDMMAEHPDWYLIPHLVPIHNRGIYDAALTTYKIEPGKPMARLENVVKNALDVLGGDTEDGIHVRHLGEGMHTIRRSGARAMFDYLTDEVGEAKALLQTSIMLDHDDPQMTLRYIDKDIERDRLSTYLKTGSMYGPGHRARAQGNVVPIRRTG